MNEVNTQTTEISKELEEIAERSRNLVREFLERTAKDGAQLKPDLESQFDPVGIGRAMIDIGQRMMANPAKMVEAQVDLWQTYMKLC